MPEEMSLEELLGWALNANEDLDMQDCMSEMARRLRAVKDAIDSDRCILDHQNRLMIWQDEIEAALGGEEA